MIYGLIIAAGKQSRFDADLPKALMPVTSEMNMLDINMNHLQSICDECYVVCSTENESYFSSYPHLTIESGYGCGDAVLRALEELPLTWNDTCFIQWGDSLHKQSIYQHLISSFKDCMLIPCVIEENPYVQIVSAGKHLCRALFSKYGEKTEKGYHDLSLFYGNANEILTALYKMQFLFWDGTKYTHHHGNELQFLDALNDVNLEAEILPINSDYSTVSFNTVEEYTDCVNKITCDEYVS